jgi:parvulin-like peptidyl-prolyl isomerase
MPESVLSPVTKLDRGYCLFMVDYKRPEYVKTFTEADAEIEKILQKELCERYQNQWKDSMEKQFNLKVFDDRLMCGAPREAAGEAAGATASATGN